MSRYQVRQKVIDISCLAVFLLSVLLVLYYVIGLAKGYYHSDCTDTIFWAEAALSGNGFTNKAFHYAGCMPLGGQVFMLLPVAIFGISVKAQIAGMLSFFVVFVISIIFLFRSFGFDRNRALVAAGIIVVSLLCSAKLREIFYEHIIYYSFDVMLTAFGAGFVLKIFDSVDSNSEKIPWFSSVGLLIVTFVAGANGTQMLALSAGTIILAVTVYKFLNFDEPLFPKEDIKFYIPFVMALFGAVLGFGFYLFVTFDAISQYASAYSSFSEVKAWKDNLFAFFPQLFGMLGVRTDSGMRLYSISGLVVFIKVFFGLMVIMVPIIATFYYRRQTERIKFLLAIHHSSSFIVMIGWVFGLLSSANWRLSPIFITGLIVTITIIGKLLFSERRVRVGALGLALTIMFLLCIPVDVLALPRQSASNKALRELAQYLEGEHLEYGYGTFWNANIVTLLSDSKVKVRSVKMSDTDIKPYRYQSNDDWYRTEGYDTYFMVLTASEYDKYYDFEMKFDELVVENFGNYYVLLYNYDIMRGK